MSPETPVAEPILCFPVGSPVLVRKLPGVCAYVLSHFSRVQLFLTLWTIARQAPKLPGASLKSFHGV